MLKFTERVGDLVELSYEGVTVQDIVNLKNALNPSVLILREGPVTLKKIETDSFSISNYGPVSGLESPTKPSRICLSCKGPDNQSFYFHRDKIPELIEALKHVI